MRRTFPPKQSERFKFVAAVHLLLIRDGKILLLRRYNTGYEDGNYSVPAGHLDGDEQATRAMVRETLEEAGITIRAKDLQMIHIMHRKKPTDEERIDFFFEAKEWKGNIHIGEPEKCDDLRWFPINKLPKNTIPYVKEAIGYYQKGIYFSEFGWEKIQIPLMLRNITFSIGSERLSARVYGKKDSGLARVLFLHGGGTSTKERTDYLAKRLLQAGIPSFSFDFSGHGQSSGILADSSLEKRVMEAKTALQFVDPDNLTVVGSSMGAYIALKLLAHVSIKNLVLFCPALYDKKAFTFRFTNDFTKTIRRHESWRNTDILPLLGLYQGNCLIIIGEDDEIIPRGVIEMVEKNLGNAKIKETIRIPNCPHAIHTFLPSHRNIADKIAKKIISIIH